MAEKLGRVLMEYDPQAPQGKRWEPAGGYSHLWKVLLNTIRREAERKGRPVRVELKLTWAGQTRSLAQNRTMWRLLRIMAQTLNAQSMGTHAVTDMDCYIDMLSEISTEFDYYLIPASGLKYLQQHMRVVKVVDVRENNHLVVKVYTGSSQFTKAQMNAFIEGLFDRLAELDCSDPEMMFEKTRWKEESQK